MGKSLFFEYGIHHLVRVFPIVVKFLFLRFPHSLSPLVTTLFKTKKILYI